MFRFKVPHFKRKVLAARIFTVLIVVLLPVAVYAAAAEGEAHVSNVFGTFWSLLPPVIAIVLALVTKEVYSSLFAGIVSGALLYANFKPELALNTMFTDGFIAKLSDGWNVGILIFLVTLGSIVILVNRAGGSAAYGKWATGKIKSRAGAQLATLALGVLIFIDDYFNCLTVGNVMRPVTDSHSVSRAKLAYLVDATAAPVCMIAPISSWAAAVAGVAGSEDGLQLFVQAIPYNFYSLLTLIFIVSIVLFKFDYGPMRLHEENAATGDLFTSGEKPAITEADLVTSPNGKVIDLLIPVVVLIVTCVIGMVYTGDFFDGVNFVDSFAGSDASVGLTLGSFIAFVFTVVYFICRRVLSFKECMESIVKGFNAMVPAILILIFAWTLSAMTTLLGSSEFVSGIVTGSAGSLQLFLPAIIFLIAVGMSFATGTSWGTFGILIPIVVDSLNYMATEGSSLPPLLIISVSACLAGAVCGDHCSPISDTTIMSSAGAQCNHINHVSTQLPYALTVAAVSFVTYIVAGFVQSAWVSLPIGIILTVGTLYVLKIVLGGKMKMQAQE